MSMVDELTIRIIVWSLFFYNFISIMVRSAEAKTFNVSVAPFGFQLKILAAIAAMITDSTTHGLCRDSDELQRSTLSQRQTWWSLSFPWQPLVRPGLLDMQFLVTMPARMVFWQ